MSIVYLRKHIQRISTGLATKIITTDEAALLCEYKSTKAFTAAFKQITGKSVKELIAERAENPLRLIENSEFDPGQYVEFFELDGRARAMLERSIIEHNPEVSTRDMRFRGVRFERGFCRVAVTRPLGPTEMGAVILSFEGGNELAAFVGYISIHVGGLSANELSALLRG